VTRLQRVDPDAVEVGPELEEVGAIRVERVARQTALELQVREEVQDEMSEGPRPGGHLHAWWFAV
jgi:hypothetical protein